MFSLTGATSWVRCLEHSCSQLYRRGLILAISATLVANAGGADWASSGWSTALGGKWSSGFEAEQPVYDLRAYQARSLRAEGDLGSADATTWLKARSFIGHWPLAERRCFSKPLKLCVIKNICRELNASTVGRNKRDRDRELWVACE